jgi:hypothetical protein
MKKGVMVLGLLMIGALALTEGAVKGGTVIDQDMIDIWGKKTGSVLFYSGKRLRVDQKDGKLSTIMDFKKNRIIILDHVTKSYVEYPFSTWEQQVSKALTRQDKPHQREIRVEPTGAERDINGFKTRQIQVFIDGVLFQDDWVTRDVNLEDMLNAIKGATNRLSGLSNAEREENEEIYRKIKAWGFPILTSEYREVFGKTLKEIIEVRGVEEQRLNPDLFLPPSRYTKRNR